MDKAKYMVTIKNEFANFDSIRRVLRYIREDVYAHSKLTIESSTSGSDTWEITFSFEDIDGFYKSQFPKDSPVLKVVDWLYECMYYTHSVVGIKRYNSAGEEVYLLYMNMMMEIRDEVPELAIKINEGKVRLGIIWAYGTLFAPKEFDKEGYHCQLGVYREDIPFVAEPYEFGGKRYVRTKIKGTNEYLNNMRLCMTQPEPQYNSFKSREMPL